MKRMVSLLMAIVMLFCLSACGASNQEGATDSTITTTTHTDGGESTSTTTAMGEDTDTTTTEGEATITESTTTTENGADKDGSATTATANKTTTTKKKTTATTTKKTTTTTTQNHSAVVCTGYKLIRVERADMESTVDGVHVLDYLLGKNKYFQQGDTLVYEFDFEKGSLADYVVEKQQNADVSVSGNLLKIKIIKNWTIVRDSYLRVWLKDKHENRLVVIDFMKNEIFWYDGKLLDETESMSRMFHIYAAEKHNIEFVASKDDEDKQYTKFMPSITNRPEGYSCDDLFYKNDVDNWVKHLQWLLCEYEKIGIVSWHCQVRGKHVVTVARVA